MALQELNEQLNNNGIDTSLWGKGKNKDIKSLRDEIVSGKCKLEVIDGVLTRIVNLVGVDIFYTDDNGVKYNLRETKEVFSNGTEKINKYEHSIGEKTEGNETPITAMRRGIREGLGLTGFVDIKKETQNKVSKLSESYPGLNSQYNRFLFSARLNNAQFKSEGYIEKLKDKTAYFGWNIVAKSEEK